METEVDQVPLSYTLHDPLPAPHPTGKNVRRSIQGVGHMMSTMVLNRKQSVFGGPSLPAGAGAPEPLDRSKFEENEDTHQSPYPSGITIYLNGKHMHILFSFQRKKQKER